MIKYKIIETKNKKYYILRYFLYFFPYRDEPLLRIYAPGFGASSELRLDSKKYDSFEDIEKRMCEIEKDTTRDKNIYSKIVFSEEKNALIELYLLRKFIDGLYIFFRY
jgi:hypothetical protein